MKSYWLVGKRKDMIGSDSEQSMSESDRDDSDMSGKNIEFIKYWLLGNVLIVLVIKVEWKGITT